jgi:hypothetical protein
MRRSFHLNHKRNHKNRYFLISKAEQEFLNKVIRISKKQGVETIDFALNFNIKAEDICFYENSKT